MHDDYFPSGNQPTTYVRITRCESVNGHLCVQGDESEEYPGRVYLNTDAETALTWVGDGLVHLADAQFSGQLAFARALAWASLIDPERP